MDKKLGMQFKTENSSGQVQAQHGTAGRQSVAIADNRPQATIQKQQLVGMETTPLLQMKMNTQNAVYQFSGNAALRYAKKHELAGEDFFLTPGGKPKKRLTRDEVLLLLRDGSLSIEVREGLRKAWNFGLAINQQVHLAKAPYRKTLAKQEKARMKEYKESKGMDQVNDYDSDVDGSSVGADTLVSKMLEEGKKVTVVTQDESESDAWVLPMGTGIRVLRIIKKHRLFDVFDGIHIIIPMGKYWQLFTAPRKNDFAYAPLLQTKPGVFMRGGQVDSWEEIARVLTTELATIQDNTFKAQLERIIGTFRGGRGPLTQGESDAVGAIIADYATGTRGAMHYLSILEGALRFGFVTDHMSAFAGKNPVYAPAAIGGRAQVGQLPHSKPKPPSGGAKGPPVADSARIDGRRYFVNVGGVRSTGECFWDTLRYYGVSNAHLALAAGATGLTVDQHVNMDSIPAFMTELSTHTGQTYRVVMDMINLINLQPMRSLTDGAGDTTIYIGFFVDPRNNQGHYVPRTG